MGSLSRATCNLLKYTQFLPRTARKELKVPKKEEYLMSYCPNIYTVSPGQPNVKNVTLVSLLMET